MVPPIPSLGCRQAKLTAPTHIRTTRVEKCAERSTCVNYVILYEKGVEMKSLSLLGWCFRLSIHTQQSTCGKVARERSFRRMQKIRTVNSGVNASMKRVTLE